MSSSLFILVEATELMSTMDTLLDERMEENGPLNKLPVEIGYKAMMLLLDFFIWDDGPRIRY